MTHVIRVVYAVGLERRTMTHTHRNPTRREILSLLAGACARAGRARASSIFAMAR